MTQFLVALAVMVLLTVLRSGDSAKRFRGPLLFIFDSIATLFALDAEFRAVANRAFNTPKET